MNLFITNSNTLTRVYILSVFSYYLIKYEEIFTSRSIQ